MKIENGKVVEMSEQEIKDFYYENHLMKQFIDKHCVMYKIDLEEACKRSTVRNTALYYINAENAKMSVSEALYGCGSGILKGDC